MIKLALTAFLLVFNSSFISTDKIKSNPVYEMDFEGVACHFEITINDKIAYRNQNRYHVKKTIPIDKFITGKGKQRIYFTLFKLDNKRTLEKKSKITAKVYKNTASGRELIFETKTKSFIIDEKHGPITTGNEAIFEIN